MSEDTTKDMPDARSFEERVMARFDALDARMGSMDGRLTSLEEKVDRRLMETRPMWEAVQVQIESLNQKFETLNDKVDRLNDKFDLVTSDLYDMRTAVKSLNRRMTALEETQPQ